MKKIKIALIGISGFGQMHIKALKQMLSKELIDFIAICEINYDTNKIVIDELISQGVKYYKSYKDLLENEKGLDIVGVSTPIHLHKQMSIDIMEAGCHVLLEKPPAVTIQDVNSIIATSKKTGKYCGVNFVLTCGDAFIELKNQMINGILGEIKYISGVGLWKRTNKYFTRSEWVGKLMVNNQYVLDGVINNPLAHLLNNMLQLACKSIGQNRGVELKNKVDAVTAELYHANEIEGDDTSCLKIEMDNGICLNYYATLCNTSTLTPRIIVEGTKGSAEWNYNNELTVVTDGKRTEYQYGLRSSVDNIEKMYTNICAVIEGREDRLYCGIEDTKEFVLVTNGAFESSSVIHEIPSKYISVVNEDAEVFCHLKDIDIIIGEALKKKELFSESDIGWAISGRRFAVGEYKKFNMFK